MDLKSMTPEAKIALGQALKAKPKEEQAAFLVSLSEVERDEILYDTHLWLRPEQYIDDSDDKYPIIMALTGRGWGKTHCSSRYVKQKVEEGVKRLGLVAPTMHDLRTTLIQGESGILNAYSPHDKNRPELIHSQSILRWPNGATAELLPAEAPERVRGKNLEVVIGDEIGSWKNAKEFFDILSYGVRLGQSRIFLTTTPRANDLIIDLYHRRDKDVRIITGSTLDNKDNLSKAMIDRAEQALNTRLGRQEVLGELILQNDGALWTMEGIEDASVHIREYPPHTWVKACIGVDPAGTTGRRSDKTGVVLSVLTDDNKVIVVEDRTERYSSEGWTNAIADLYEEYSKICPVIVAVERNGAGAYVMDILKRAHSFLPIKDFASTANKFSRAMAVAHQFETGNVKMSKDHNLAKLQEQMIVWDNTKSSSPDRIDAMVFSCQELISGKQNVTMSKEFLF